MKMTRVLNLIGGAAICGAMGLGSGAWGQAAGKDYAQSPLVTRMMAFDANHDGKLTKDEVTDARLKALFDQADVNSDGVVTKDELIALAAKLDAEQSQMGNGGGGPGGPGGFGGPGGRGGPGGPPQPGIVLPGRLQDQLNLTDDQKTQVAVLQAEVDKKLAEILTADQTKQLAQMRAWSRAWWTDGRRTGWTRGTRRPDGRSIGRSAGRAAAVRGMRGV